MTNDTAHWFEFTARSDAFSAAAISTASSNVRPRRSYGKPVATRGQAFRGHCDVIGHRMGRKVAIRLSARRERLRNSARCGQHPLVVVKVAEAAPVVKRFTPWSYCGVPPAPFRRRGHGRLCGSFSEVLVEFCELWPHIEQMVSPRP